VRNGRSSLKKKKKKRRKGDANREEKPWTVQPDLLLRRRDRGGERTHPVQTEKKGSKNWKKVEIERKQHGEDHKKKGEKGS